MGGGLGGAWGGGGSGRVGLGGGGPGGAHWGGGGSRWGDLGCWGGGGGGHRLPLPPLALPLIKTEYWDRAGGGGNISYDW